ncbi:hypothetical protein L1987_39180 [Smallanthus sonchifolius]|uniref:Uncharacterized protein n=1 Tax=Smallanthus sonchifolius TaxID=185202 RepID=A0ACB9HKP1_9ASTR|nr:hypothetical protein L1987_39180 [Smallanthus sonchifolius]
MSSWSCYEGEEDLSGIDSGGGGSSTTRQVLPRGVSSPSDEVLAKTLNLEPAGSDRKVFGGEGGEDFDDHLHRFIEFIISIISRVYHFLRCWQDTNDSGYRLRPQIELQSNEGDREFGPEHDLPEIASNGGGDGDMTQQVTLGVSSSNSGEAVIETLNQETVSGVAGASKKSIRRKKKARY